MNRRPYAFGFLLIMKHAMRSPAPPPPGLSLKKKTTRWIPFPCVHILISVPQAQSNLASKFKPRSNSHTITKCPNPLDRSDAGHYTHSNSGTHAQSPQGQTARPELQRCRPVVRGSAFRGLVGIVISTCSKRLPRERRICRSTQQGVIRWDLPALACQAI